MKNAIADLMTNLDTCDQVSAWEESLKFFEGFGFHITNYGIIDKAHGDILGFHSNMDDGWMNHYLDSEYGKDDPWVGHVVSNSESILYSRDGPSDLEFEKGSIADQMINEASEFKLNTSLCVPIHNKYCQSITGFNLGSKMGHFEFQSMLDERKDEILLGVALLNNELIETPTDQKNVAGWYSNPHYKRLLSSREIEVLKWLSEGHRNDRIAEKMNIASVTVNFHLKEIRQKLGAQTREQAVAIAFRRGLLR